MISKYLSTVQIDLGMCPLIKVTLGEAALTVICSKAGSAPHWFCEVIIMKKLL